MRPESDFTPPSEMCPHPERWHSPDQDGTESEVSFFIHGLVRALKPRYSVETGAYHGQTSEAIGSALVDNRHGRLTSLETDAERVRIARKEVDTLPVTILHQSSLVFTPDQDIDFAFFDSAPDLRRREFERFYPYMHEATIVCFHDSAKHQVSVRRDIETLYMNQRLRPVFLPTPRGLAICQVLTARKRTA